MFVAPSMAKRSLAGIAFMPSSYRLYPTKAATTYWKSFSISKITSPVSVPEDLLPIGQPIWELVPGRRYCSGRRYPRRQQSLRHPHADAPAIT